MHFEAASLFGSLSDVVGSRSGLALNERDVRALLAREEDERFVEYLALQEDDWVRINSAVYEDIVECSLLRVFRWEHIRQLDDGQPLAVALARCFLRQVQSPLPMTGMSGFGG